ncbi:MAG TPA: protein-tyrosine-phosphatase [Magnetospirillum sp.]|jgi:predicted protein tyrosine phosphatase|nr:protein-tyrosine-phosphatase [Magnetospirillum sp.]
MRPLLPYRLTICGLAELCLHGAAGVTDVLTILDPGWPDPEDFAVWPAHRRTTLRFHDIVTERDGMAPPQVAHVRAILEWGQDAVDGEVNHLLVHCHMGISRSTAAAAMLMAQHNDGREEEVFAEIRRIRPSAWPNSRMLAMADGLMGRGGRLVEAMRGHHARVARAFPQFVEQLRQSERAGELPEDLR